MKNLSLADAKQRLWIPDLWRHFGFAGEPRKTCRCPFHEDRSASFSISPDGLLWNCFAGCGGGDAISFLQLARGLSQGDACREFLRLAGGGVISAPRVNTWEQPMVKERPSHRVEAPGLTLGRESDWRKLATLRNVSLEAVALAVHRGLLRFGTHKGRAAWLVTDCTLRNVQARRMDGEPWPEIGGKKAYTLPGSQAAWPLGIKEAAPFPTLALCEGGPDLLAAFHFIICEAREADCAAVTMLGASLAIHADAIPSFAGKRVRIFGHDDDSGAGRRAVERWACQLAEATATADAFNFAGLVKGDGSPVGDLNDCISICPEEFDEDRELWRMLP